MVHDHTTIYNLKEYLKSNMFQGHYLNVYCSKSIFAIRALGAPFLGQYEAAKPQKALSFDIFIFSLFTTNMTKTTQAGGEKISARDSVKDS